MERTEQMKRLRDQGLKYQEIAEMFGVSRQYVHQCVTSLDTKRGPLTKKTIYSNLFEWAKEHKCSRDEFLLAMGLPADDANRMKLHRILTGKQSPKKDYIDKMLQATGLSYETLFEVLPDGSKQ